jgi:hypothetical protein
MDTVRIIDSKSISDVESRGDIVSSISLVAFFFGVLVFGLAAGRDREPH